MSPRTLDYEPAEIIPPGETLAEWLEQADMTQAEFAKRTSLTTKHINQVVKGNVGLSPEVALAFERVTQIPARYWIQLEANHEAAKHRQLEEVALADHLDILDRFPLKELEKRGFLAPRATKVDELKELLRFFAVADPRALTSVWLQPTQYRLSPSFTADPSALASWLRVAELAAARIKTRPFEALACRSAVKEMRALSRLPGVDWLEPLTQLCASVGIALVIVKELPKCRVNGATRWLSPERVTIAISLRHRRNDIFWFTLFHELCHVLRHSKKQTFIDAKGSIIATELEAEADEFAARVLIPPGLAHELPLLRTAADVEEFAARAGIAPGIVVGRMRHDKLARQNQWSSLLEYYTFDDD